MHSITSKLLAIAQKHVRPTGTARVLYDNEKYASMHTIPNHKTDYIDTTARSVPPRLPYRRPYYPRPSYDSIPSLDELKSNYVKRWNNDFAKPFREHNAYRCSLKPFSPEFQNAIGCRALRHIYGIEDHNLARKFWMMLLECRAKYAYDLGDSSNTGDFWRALSNKYTIEPGQVATWRNYSEQGVGFIELVAHALTLDQWDACATLGHLHQMDPMNLIRLHSVEHACEQNASRQCQSWIPSILISVTPDAPVARLLDRRDILGHSNQTIGALLHYELGDDDFCVPATVGRGELCIGKYKSTAHFLNQYLINQYSEAVIILFQDLRVAMAIQRRLDEIAGYSPQQFVVTAHLGDRLDILRWCYLSGHDVVFVPAPDAKSFGMFSKYNKFAESIFANSCKLAKRLFIHVHPDSKILSQISLENEEETKLLHETVVVPECDDIIRVLRGTVASAIDFKASEEWLTSLGLRVKKAAEKSVSSCAEMLQKLPVPHPSSLPPHLPKLADVTLYHTAKPGSYVLITGKKDTGKTQCAWGLIRQLICGDQIWPFCPPKSEMTENVCCVDGETDLDDLRENARQYQLEHMLNKRLFLLSYFDTDKPDFCENF